ncbi:MAG: CpsD/CapB family tyrosine-protein kinase [Clostridia bacterium]|nr:CpsD/CapB family tyrosine-protein kinase [Clostridia bacterium]
MKSLSIGRFPPLSYACGEAVNTLCTNLSFSGENVKKIMITSCHASEGKSFLSMNIMRTMAKFGKTVAIVDADLRRSMIASKYSIQFADKEHRWGLAHLLAGMADMDDVIYSTDIDGAYMVPVGREVSNPLPLLNSPRLGELLDRLAQGVDYVFVDAPPVGTVIDAAEIAKSCDGTLLVVNYNTVRRQELIDVKEQLEQTECPILGTVLNMVEYDSYLSRKYYYKSYYSKYDRYEKDTRKSKHSGQKESKAKRT